jgi:acyl carrier protein
MPQPDELKQEIKQMIVERLFLDVEPDQISDDENLMEAYDIDSVLLFEIVVGLEEVFGVSLEDADFSVETFATVSNIADFIAAMRG